MLSAREWLTIALFCLSGLLTVVGYLLVRFINKVDKLELAVYGEQGLFRALSQYVKREQHDVANAELAAHMDKMRLEGVQREGRIIEAIEQREGKLLEAIGREGDRATTENRITRGELAKLHERVDRIRDGARHQ
jgi:hypothetical protein